MISQQLISLIYGAIVNQVIDSSEHFTQVNIRLQKIGFKIGNKLLDQYMRDVKDRHHKECTKVQELVQRFTMVGVKRFLNPLDVSYDQLKISENGFSFRINIRQNPLLRNLELDQQQKSFGLQYQSIIKGCMRGVFDVMKYRAKVMIILEQKETTIYYIQAQKKMQNTQ